MDMCQTRAASRAPYICRFHLSDPRPAPYPTVFVGDVSPTNVTEYIRGFYVTDEYDDLNSSINLSVNRQI
jgi:hypothetical protein